jgi:uncharacterized protein HemY
MEHLDKAEDNLLKAVERISNDPVIFDHLGDLYSRKGDYLKAREYYQKSLLHGTEPDDIKKVRDKLERLQKQKKSQ